MVSLAGVELQSCQKAVDGYRVDVVDPEHEGNYFGGDALQLHQFQNTFLRRVALDLDK